LIVSPFKKLWKPFFDLEEMSAVGLKSINVTERKDDLLVEVQVPGFKKENLELFVNHDTITLSGKMCESMQDQDGKVGKDVIYTHIHE
jgi:HSP20 family molecular chaperone IbpA